MKVFIVYAHPSVDSFTSHAKDSFIRGLESAGHNYIISDLYRMNFKTDMEEHEYYRESNYLEDIKLSQDVVDEHNKINGCDAIVFIYPVFWTEAPAKLVGWFDRVWTYGFAYGNRTMKTLGKGLVICITGHSLQTLKEYGHYAAMETVMLGDRLFDRVKQKEFIVLDGMTKYNEEVRRDKWSMHIDTAYNAGLTI